MSHLFYSNYPGYGEHAKTEYWYSQAVRIGDRIECAGQGGWDRESFEISKDGVIEMGQAFENVGHNLKIAGGTGWDQVFLVRSYHVNLNDRIVNCMVRMLREYCPRHQPLWTCIGVDKLGRDDMKVEIEVTAHISQVTPET